MGFIYKITNDITNKNYIGQTSRTVEDRFKEHFCIETGEEYSSALQAAKAKGLKNSSGISRCCKKERQTAGGFHWRFKDNQEVEE